MPGLNIGGGTHNVLFVATLNNTVYAIDADTPTTIYWSAKLRSAPTPFAGLCTTLNSKTLPHGGAGIVSTPVIDANLGYIYFVTKTGNGARESLRANFLCREYLHRSHSRLHQSSIPEPSTGTRICRCRARPSPKIPTGSYIYVGLGATGCQDFEYEHGYVMAYSTTTGASPAYLPPPRAQITTGESGRAAAA